MTTNYNPNTKRTDSQRSRILAYLQEGNSLTPLQALLMFGTTKLATRVSELILEDGHTEIEKKWVEVETSHGRTARVKLYYIPRKEDKK